MNRYKVVIKRIVSSDGKIIAEAKNIVATSDNNQSEITQSVSVNVSSGTSSSSCFSSSNSSQSGYSSTSGSISVSCDNG
ncbi:hypothetical protein F7734_15130 [Scytonema sp. UIC 10036]|uniref:hypothetical protein n=1 Tax=Scytonema sp. UIC 10036 TaxID=2304196 RepID=UPI0012DAD892|nr:hypothetical protein [Scytonema sp. UIC 10036]MUG93680.1 hypothetical protein [Scytonema sp. UIC 10036]